MVNGHRCPASLVIVINTDDFIGLKIPQRHETLKIHIFTNLKAIALKLWNYFVFSEANGIVNSFFGKNKIFQDVMKA